MPPAPQPACPRCGYDQSGVAAAWREQCPLDGVCSECGLTFHWADVLNPALTTPAWSFEHTASRLLRRLFATALRALAPWRFWRRIRLEHPIRVRRLAIVVIACAAFVHLLYGAVQGWLVYNASLTVQMWAGAGAPAARRAPWQEAVGAMIWPYADIVVGTGWRGAMVRSFVRATDLVVVLILVATALALLLLPESFRRARIRRMHVLRGGAMSFVIIAPLAAAWVGGLWLISVTAQRGVVMISGAHLQAALALAAVAWLWTYWRMFVVRYLRLQHGGLVATSMLAIGILSVSTAIVLVGGERAWMWLEEFVRWLARGY
ncbi:MAG: hypothetical protein ACF8R7_18105 [Phycisphaerales bacterium JB039]